MKQQKSIPKPLGGGQLADLEHFVAYTKDPETVYLKKHSYVIFDITKPSNFYEILSNGDFKSIDLPSGTTKVEGLDYGFKLVTNVVAFTASIFSPGIIDLTHYDTSNVTDMSRMFFGTYSDFEQYRVTVKINKLNTSKVTDMSYMFGGIILEGSEFLNDWDTSNVSNMNYMFYGCNTLTSLYLSNWNTSAVTDMSAMFYACNSLKYIKCKQSFKDWCLQNQDNIYLPESMREGGNGTWDIVD